MSESYDYTPAPWARGHDFSDARKAYSAHKDTSFASAVKTGINPTDLVPAQVSTVSEKLLVVVTDGTGSMGDWLVPMFEKYPYLEHEAEEYLGNNVPVSWCVFGDGLANDRYPLQVKDFASGPQSLENLKGLVIEKGGGGQYSENSDLAALYYARNCSIPNAIKPIMVFVSDEKPWDPIDRDLAKAYARVELSGRLSTAAVFKELKSKFSVYLVRKPYGLTHLDKTNRMDAVNLDILETWVGLLGADHVKDLPDGRRVVDVIMGILALEAGKEEEFDKELKGRQTKEQYDTVMKSLKTVHGLPPGTSPKSGHSGRSVMRRSGDGTSMKSLED